MMAVGAGVLPNKAFRLARQRVFVRPRWCRAGADSSSLCVCTQQLSKRPRILSFP